MRPKKIDTWKFQIDRVSVEVAVYLGKPERYRSALGHSFFIARAPAYDVDLQDGDINVLRVAVEKALREKVTVTWVPFYLLEFEGTLFDEEDFTQGSRLMFLSALSLKLEVSEVEIGTKPDGTKCWRNPEYNQIHDGMPDDVRKERTYWCGRERRNETKCLLPRTAEILASIVRLQTGLTKQAGFLLKDLAAGNLKKANFTVWGTEK